jgi:hypothetical protein
MEIMDVDVHLVIHVTNFSLALEYNVEHNTKRNSSKHSDRDM